MATLKHINSKNADYGAAEQYLLFEHDEFTMKPVLDETGRLIPREDYRLSTLNCDGEDFAVACMRANLRYQKNQRREDVKSHHYIISFDPRDGPDNGLTVDRAQALGEQFCKEHFPGHQALVCTHPDGHNHSGNIHVHIVINSLRIEEVPFLPYMDRPADTKVGCKHRCTDAALRYFKSEVMEMCHREGLYQIDLLNGSKNRVTDREYWAQKSEKARAAYRQAHESDFIIADAAARYFKAHGITKLPPGKRCRPRSSSLSPRKTACITPITNRNSGSRSCRPSSGTSTRFCAGTSRTAERSRAMSDNLPHMDYRQHRRARRLVHECCNYDEGNCLLLDDGEPCVCVQSISFSLMCHWFRVAVLPLDGELAAALLCRGSRKRCAVCGAAFVPKSNRGKYCPDCAGRMKKIKAAERKRKQRQRCHALEPFKPA